MTENRSPCAYCQEAPSDSGYDRCYDCRTWRDEEWCQANGVEHGSQEANTKARLEYLRGEIQAGRISYGEIADLQGLAEHIDPGDVELAQWAGVSEKEFATRGSGPPDNLCGLCGVRTTTPGHTACSTCA